MVIKYTNKHHTHQDEFSDGSKIIKIEANMNDFYIHPFVGISVKPESF